MISMSRRFCENSIQGQQEMLQSDTTKEMSTKCLRQLIRSILAVVSILLISQFFTSSTFAFSSTKPAAIWRTEALLQIAVGHAETGDLTAAEESLALAIEESAFVFGTSDREEIQEKIIWTKARLGQGQEALNEAEGMVTGPDDLVVLLGLAAFFEANGEQLLFQKTLKRIHGVVLPANETVPEAGTRVSWPAGTGWYLARGAWVEEAKALARTIMKVEDRYAFTAALAGGQMASGDWLGGKSTLKNLIEDPDIDHDKAGGRLPWASYLLSLSGEEERALSIAIESNASEPIIESLTAAAMGSAAAGDLAGTLEVAARVYHEMNFVGGLGLEVESLAAEEAQEAGFGTEGGLFIKRLDWEGPGWNAGLEVGDQLLSFNGTKIENDQDPENMAAQFSAFTPVYVGISRNGVEQQFRVVLGRGRNGNSLCEGALEAAKMVAFVKAGETENAFRFVKDIKPVETRALALLTFGAAMDLLEKSAEKRRALNAATEISFPKPSDRDGKSNIDWADFSAALPFAINETDTALLSSPLSGTENGNLVSLARLFGALLVGRLERLPDDLYREMFEFSFLEIRPDIEIWRAEFLARAGRKFEARQAAKALTNHHDRKFVREQVVLLQAAAGELESARVLALQIHGKKKDGEDEDKTVAREQLLARLDRLAKGEEKLPPVPGALLALPGQEAAEVVDPYRRARTFMAIAANYERAGEQKPAVRALILAVEAAEAETVPFYRGMAFAALAEAQLLAGQKDGALASLDEALAAFDE